MIQKLKKLQTVSRAILLLAFAIPFVLIFMPFVKPILMAMVVALAIEPILEKIGSRTKRKRYFAVGLVLFFIFFILIPISVFANRIVKTLMGLSTESMQESQFFQALFSLWDNVQSSVRQLTEALGIESSIIPNKEELFMRVSPFFVEKTKLLLAALPDLGLSLFVFFSILVLLTTRSSLIKKVFVHSKILPAEEIEQVTELLKSSCYLTLVSIFLIGALQALIVSLGSLVFGYHEFFLIFALTFFLSFIPVIGAAPVAVLLALISFINGNAGQGVGMTIIAAVAGTIDNILKPYVFAGESKNLHPLVSLFGIVGAIMVFGLSGLLLGPLIMQVTTKLGPPLVQKLLA